MNTAAAATKTFAECFVHLPSDVALLGHVYAQYMAISVAEPKRRNNPEVEKVKNLIDIVTSFDAPRT